ncbi:DUF6382 domain-containing protein [Paenibacillus sp. CAU 1782]
MMSRFVVDFEMNAGHEMTLGREPGIQRSELYELELNMLQAADISALLRMDWVNIDGAVTFRYALSGSKLLLHRLQQHAITMEQYYGLLLSTVDALTECGDYMLRPEGCLLDESLIYVGERMHELRFVYVPIDHKGYYGYNNGDLLSLAVKWLSYVELVDGEGLRSILQLFGTSKWPLERLRALLLELIGKSAPSNENTLGAKPLNVIPSIDEPLLATATQRETRLGKAEKQQALKEAEFQFSSKASAPEEETTRSSENDFSFPEPDETAENQQGKARGWLGAAAFLIGTALVWRFIYMTEPSSRNLYLSLGLTLALLAIVLFIIKRGQRFFVQKLDEDVEGDWNSLEPDTGYLPASNRRFRALEQRDEPIKKSGLEAGEGTTASIGDYSLPSGASLTYGERQGNSADFGDFGQRSVKSAQYEPTVLLSRGGEEPGGIATNEVLPAALRRKWNGVEEDIHLSNDIFRIGRSGENTNYMENADGVSRVHLEIGRSGEEHHAKDLGSRNGSILNGNLMVPYKVYKLVRGDIIHLGGEKGPQYSLV